jgi:hypothetical protein
MSTLDAISHIDKGGSEHLPADFKPLRFELDELKSHRRFGISMRKRSTDTVRLQYRRLLPHMKADRPVQGKWRSL